MNINSGFIQQQYDIAVDKQRQNLINDKNITNKMDDGKLENKKDDQKLKKVVNEFTSIFINKMFASMRNTLPEDKLIDGGFAEDVFTEMLDQEISKMGAEQSEFSNLNRILYQQLIENQIHD